MTLVITTLIIMSPNKLCNIWHNITTKHDKKCNTQHDDIQHENKNVTQYNIMPIVVMLGVMVPNRRLMVF